MYQINDVVDVTSFHTNPEKQMAAVIAVKKEKFSRTPYPSWTAIGVSWLSGFDFEIKVTARIPSRASASVSRHNPPTMWEMAPLRYSQISVAEPGRLAFLSGQIASTPGSEEIPEDLAGQAKLATASLAVALEHLEATAQDIVMVRVYVVNATNEAFGQAVTPLRGLLGEAMPSITTIGVQALYKPEFKVEIEMVVRLPEPVGRGPEGADRAYRETGVEYPVSGPALRPLLVNAMPPTNSKRPRATGQPRNFDRPRALESAMKLFWERGYEGTSMDEIFEAMELSPSSFYNTFGNKEALYQELVAFYFSGAGTYFARALARGRDTREAFRLLLDDTAAAITSPTLPHGCFISLAATHIGPGLESVRSAMTEHRLCTERALVTRIEQGMANGDMPADTDARELAGYFDAIIRGMAVKARDGANRKQLRSLGARAMLAWPASPSALR